MKTLQLFVVALAVSFATPTQAQTADEIINNYFENTGGMDNWRKIEGMTMYAKINQGGMEIPIEISRLKDGRQMTVINLQGQVFKQGVFDGETLWGMNFQTMKAEKSDAETTENFKTQINDFPNPIHGPLMDYKEKGYTVELMGTEEFDGTECFKLMVETEPITVDGQEEKSITFYYFDTENFVPIAILAEIKQGQAKGMMSETTLSDYQEVGDVYLPFSMASGIKDGASQAITMDKIELNPEIDDAEFKFPEDTAEGEDENDNENKN